jgi:hypothetical protein
MMNPIKEPTKIEVFGTGAKRTLHGQGVAIGIVIGFIMATVAHALN